jgi:hypothetical protein
MVSLLLESVTTIGGRADDGEQAAPNLCQEGVLLAHVESDGPRRRAGWCGGRNWPALN